MFIGGGWHHPPLSLAVSAIVAVDESNFLLSYLVYEFRLAQRRMRRICAGTGSDYVDADDVFSCASGRQGSGCVYVNSTLVGERGRGSKY